MKSTPIIVFVCSVFILAFVAMPRIGMTAPVERDRLIGMVEGLSLSFKGYRLGSTLNSEQFRFGEEHRSEKSFPGTYTIVDDSVQVVVDAETHRVIAVYQTFKDVGQDQVKQVIGSLMGAFGEPSNIAHDKIIYWLYTPNGSLSSEAFEKAKDSDDGSVNIIASVKLSSSRPIEQADTPTTLYWILSSNQLALDYIQESPAQ